MKPTHRTLLPLLACLALSTTARAGWTENGWGYRRTLDVPGDVAGLPATTAARAEFYTDGHALPTAADVRVTTEDGKPVGTRVLDGGATPGDRVRLAFETRPGVGRYYAYFGNPAPPPPPPEVDPANVRGGLFMETRAWTGGGIHNFEQIERSFDRSKPVLGQTVLDHPFLGYNPFGDQVQYASRLDGTLTAPVDGTYEFAMSVDDEAGLWVDAAPTLFAHFGPSDIRFHASVHLARGPHAFRLIHVNAAGEGRFAVGWKLAAGPKVDIIPRSAFGTCLVAAAGPLEHRDHPLTADPGAATLLGEVFVGDGYALRYHFAAKAKVEAAVRYAWDFGDGQRATGPDVDHVYLTAGVYPVKLTLHAGANTDSATARVVVERDYRRILEMREESAAGYATIAAGYDVGSLVPEALPRLVQLHLKGDRVDAAVAAGTRLAGLRNPPDVSAALAATAALEQRLVDTGRADVAVTVWDRAPADAATQPTAARRGAELACWWTGDFDKAAKLLAPFHAATDPGLRQLYGQSLVLAGRADEGRKVLDGLPVDAPPMRAAALSGAAARTVEFFITEKDPESGEAAWNRWMTRFPADFTDGYAVVLRTKLMVLRHREAAAAKVAEAFATAAPRSSYAPQLLDSASRLLAQTDPARSQALRQTLKQKYPEDPLSQN